MQVENHDTFIGLCLKKIEEKLNWRPVHEWRNYEFEELSEKILDETGVHISSTTLKRIFGRLKYDSEPSTATLNALASFIGYQSWMEFKSSIAQDQKPAIVRTKKIFLHTPIHRRVWLAGMVTFIGIGVFLVLSGRSKPITINSSSVIFTSRPLAEGLPNSVVFNVDMKGNEADKLYIQQSWDSTRTVQLQQGQKEATGIYYLPGYFRAKLIADGKIIKEHDLFIKSSEWMATIDVDPVPTYLTNDKLIFDGQMKPSSQDLEKLKLFDKPTYLTYHLVRPLGDVQSDNFSFESSVRNIYGEGAAICKTMKLFFLCTDGAFIIPFTIPGCAGSINLKLNDKYLPGRSNDLSAFGVDLTAWTKIRVVSENRKVKIYFNDQLLKEASYEKDAGKIVGIRFSFLGAGEVDYVKLLNGKNEIIYDNQFPPIHQPSLTTGVNDP